ncbi:hypothetical protein DFQ27_004906 [Actinomortierella ambigua]|uniref:Brl1/Brr6 domain-containing protein n=1 Tax=Actinomortierella ambigua TaxID=1343610 RepID=A0A9P6Q4E8_9FUNG|nr:hypothetical protein DFQ27_004906 [Actinomortierella ambigua]
MYMQTTPYTTRTAQILTVKTGIVGHIEESRYAQLLLNMVLFGCLFVIGYNAYAAIQDDISLEVDEMARRRLRTYKDCEYNYYRHFNCETPSDGALPFCRKYQQCMDENRSPLVGKAVASAHTFAAIANAFAHTLTFKAMFFFLILFLGGIFVSNYVLNSYRSNYVLHHQHHIAPGTLPKGGAPFTEPKDRKESNSSSFFSRARMGDKDSTDSSRIGRITDDGASRRLLPARSGLSSCMDDGDSSGSDGDIPSTRRVLALTSS